MSAGGDYTVLVLGGYGFFGGRICRALGRSPGLRVLVGGRDAGQARAFCERLREQSGGNPSVEPLAIDKDSPDFAALLDESGANLAIHTVGPFQGQGYDVARACIDAGVDYIDLADAREFVRGIGALDGEARARGVLVVSGASSVPAISTAVIDYLAPRFAALRAVDIGINPANKTSRGLATVKAVLSYCGRPFTVLTDGDWKTVHGWQGWAKRWYPSPMGPRWLAWCEVPDLSLLPERYSALTTAVFKAGPELGMMAFGIWICSWLTRLHLVTDWSRLAGPLRQAGEWLMPLGTDVGGMHVEVSGISEHGGTLNETWYLLAGSNDGPQVPCTPAIILAKKRARGELPVSGAMPCVGLITLDEVLRELEGFDVRTQIASSSATKIPPAPPL